MSVLGADIAALRGLVNSLTSRVRLIEKTKSEMSTLVLGLPWVGPDREQFLREWNEIHQVNLIRLMDDMTIASNQALHAANAQEEASRAGG